MVVKRNFHNSCHTHKLRLAAKEIWLLNLKIEEKSSLEPAWVSHKPPFIVPSSVSLLLFIQCAQLKPRHIQRFDMHEVFISFLLHSQENMGNIQTSNFYFCVKSSHFSQAEKITELNCIHVIYESTWSRRVIFPYGSTGNQAFQTDELKKMCMTVDHPLD